MILIYPLQSDTLGHCAPEFEFEVEPTGKDVYEYCASLAKSASFSDRPMTEKTVTDSLELVLDSMNLWPSVERDRGFREFVSEKYAKQARAQYEFDCEENGTHPLDFE